MNVRLRQDLEFLKRAMQQGDVWVVKDPISFNHFLFSSHEYQLLLLFDGTRTADDIRDAWRQQFSTKSLTSEQIRQFVNRLVGDNLVSVDEFGYGDSLYRSQATMKKRKLRSLFLSPLVIRFRGINPRFMLDSLAWIGWMMFHPLVVGATMCCALLLLIYMFGHFEELAYRVPAISQLLSAQGILGMVVTISIVKIFHELGHAMACQRCGGECFEIGLILLAFIPTLYCNVSDAWTFPERWKRLLVSFGGIYVEIILAAIASVVWLMTEPGLLNAMMFNVVFLCSVNTILVNGNPLLRYDGYYLLSDATEQPNLSSVARETLNFAVVSMFRIPKRQKEVSPWILTYAVLSFLYRWFVLISIMCMVYLFLKSIGLRVIGQVVTMLLLASLLLRPMMSKSLLRGGSGNWGRFSVVRSAFPVACIALFLAAFFLMPLPSYVRCNLIVEAKNPTPIYVPSKGKLTYVCGEFDTVKSGQTIAQIESLEIDQKIQILQNKLDRGRNSFAQLKLRANEDPLAAAQLVVIQKNIEANEDELAVLQEEHSKLTVKAPLNGVALPAPIRKAKFSNDEQLRKWQGQLTDEINQNCFVERGEQLLSIHSEGQKTITLFVGEREIDFVKKDQPVEMLFAQQPGTLFAGIVGDIYEVDVDLNKDQTVGEIGVETYEDASGRLQSLETPYRVTVIAETVPKHAFVGSGGRARISIPYKTFAEKTAQFFERLASFNL